MLRGEIRTPNIDRLAAEGMRFSQFYNTARCSPTRASLLTGLYPHQTGVSRLNDDLGFDGYRGELNDRCATIAQLLKTSGYATYMSGKWHLTGNVGHWSGAADKVSKQNWPLQRGFDRFWGTIDGHGSFYNPRTLTDGNDPQPETKAGFYYTDEISAHAVKYIDEHESENPFFLYIAHTAPHWPLHALEKDIQKYEGVFDQGWDKLRTNRFHRMVELGLADFTWVLNPLDPSVPEWDKVNNPEWQLSRMMAYAAQIDSIDRGVGQVIDALRRKNVLQNTLILFLSDNGGSRENLSQRWQRNSYLYPKTTRSGETIRFGNEQAPLEPGPENTYQSYGSAWANLSNTPFRMYKRFTHEGGIATPLIAYWPSLIENHGKISRQPGHVIDIMPTCLDVAGIDYPSSFGGVKLHPLEGTSLVPFLKDANRKKHRFLFWEHEANRAVRDGDWKLVSKVKAVRKFTESDADAWELYNLDADRTEMHDLASQFPERVHMMAQLWEDWAIRAKALPWPWGEGDPLSK